MVGASLRTDDGGGLFDLPWWTSLLTPPVMITAAVLLVAVAAAVLVTARILYKRARRSPALADAVLRVRAAATGGPQQEVLQLRIRLREALDSGQTAIDLSLKGDGPTGELPQLFRRIQREGVALEQQLRLMESETDRAVLAQGVSLATRRVDQVAGLVRRLRGAIALDLGELTDGSLNTLRDDVDREVVALHAGVQEMQSLNGSVPSSAPVSEPEKTRPTAGEQS